MNGNMQRARFLFVSLSAAFDTGFLLTLSTSPHARKSTMQAGSCCARLELTLDKEDVQVERISQSRCQHAAGRWIALSVLCVAVAVCYCCFLYLWSVPSWPMPHMHGHSVVGSRYR